jgi:hypothetical protein
MAGPSFIFLHRPQALTLRSTPFHRFSTAICDYQFCVVSATHLRHRQLLCAAICGDAPSHATTPTALLSLAQTRARMYRTNVCSTLRAPAIFARMRASDCLPNSRTALQILIAMK